MLCGMGTEYLTASEAAARMGISPETLRRKLRAGKLPTFKFEHNRRNTYLRMADVDRLMNEPVEDNDAAANHQG